MGRHRRHQLSVPSGQGHDGDDDDEGPFGNSSLAITSATEVSRPGLPWYLEALGDGGWHSGAGEGPEHRWSNCAHAQTNALRRRWSQPHCCVCGLHGRPDRGQEIGGQVSEVDRGAVEHGKRRRFVARCSGSGPIVGRPGSVLVGAPVRRMRLWPVAASANRSDSRMNSVAGPLPPRHRRPPARL